MTKIQKKKQELKEIAKEIRRLKSTRKKVLYGWVEELMPLQNKYRLHHVAYCMFRGKTLEQIEVR